jgi:hypothetical protein
MTFFDDMRSPDNEVSVVEDSSVRLLLLAVMLR